MATPVIERLIGIEGCPIVTTENLDEFLALDGMVVLFFTGDPRQRPESNDVAVVLREMASVFPGQFRIGIVDHLAEEALKPRFGVLVVPTLVFARCGSTALLIQMLERGLNSPETTSCGRWFDAACGLLG